MPGSMHHKRLMMRAKSYAGHEPENLAKRSRRLGYSADFVDFHDLILSDRYWFVQKRIRDQRVVISAWQTRSVDARAEEMALSRIDTHHHLFPSKYLAAIEQHGVKAAGGGIAFPEWSPAASLEMMDRYGIQTAILSLSSPGVYFGDVRLARDLARICNDYGAELVRQYPERLGYFASVPLPATGDAVAEAAYAYDTLNCDGVVLLSDVGDRFLGDPEFEELMQELNRRNAIVFVHPNVHSTSRQLGLKFPEALFEFLADTTRAVLNLTLSGTLERNPNIRWILSHAGGAIPSHAWRWALADRNPIVEKNAPKGVLAYLRQLYFDTALSPSRYAMKPAIDLAGSNHIVFGSDFPYVHGEVLDFEIKELDQLDVFDADARQAMTRTNALSLFPRFQLPRHCS
jgi:6-methylsalicylate decarboxylase